MRARLRWIGVGLVVLLVAFLLATLMAPGEIVSPTVGNFGGGYEVVYEHGWPFVWGYRSYFYGFTKSTKTFPDLPLYGIPWLAWDSWSLWEADRWKVSWFALAFDLTVAGLVMVFIAWLSRRFFASPFRFRLRDLLVFVTLFSLTIGWWFAWRRGHVVELRRLEALADVGGYEDAYYVGPLWLKRLVGESFAGDAFQRTRHASINLARAVEFDEAASHLASLSWLESLEIDCPRGVEPNLRLLSGVPKLRFLSINKRLDEKDVAELAELQRLEEICLGPWAKQDPEVRQRLMGALPNCRIVGEDLRTWLDGEDARYWEEAFWLAD